MNYIISVRRTPRRFDTNLSNFRGFYAARVIFTKRQLGGGNNTKEYHITGIFG